MKRLLHLYRPQLPSTRAQAIQVLRTCDALAHRGYRVTLIANRGPNISSLWLKMGLKKHPNLHLKVAPNSHPGLSGVWFRRQVKQWWKGPPGVVLARDKRRLLQAIRKHGKQEHRVILETHGLESLLNPKSNDAFTVERQCLAIADGLIANCGGTLRAWQEAHTLDLPQVVSHNATHIELDPDPTTQDFLLVLGSMRINKGVRSLLDVAGKLPYEMRWVGGSESERALYTPPNHIKLLPPVHHADIAEVIARARVLVAPLGDNPFSHQLTSPLKLWDYLAAAQPIVSAKTSCTLEIEQMSGVPFHLYTPENQDSIQHAIETAWNAPNRKVYRREWSDRVAEIMPLLEPKSHA